MRESDATALARGNGRLAVGPGRTSAAAVRKEIEGPVVADTDRNVTALRPDAPSALPAPELVLPEVPPGNEIELKLLVEPGRLADFDDAPVITAHARNKGARWHLKSVYYDTRKRLLWRNGLTLRVRQIGSRFVQTVKTQETQETDNPLRRGEWEASVSSLQPDLALALPFIPARLRDGLTEDKLETVFVSDIHRHQRLLDLPTGTVEVAFDQGVITAGERTLPVNEIELELKSGSTVAIYEIARRLAEHGPLRPSIHAKSARGFDLAAHRAPTAEKPRKLSLDPAVSLDESFAVVLRGCFTHLLQSIPAAEDGRDVEGVHQLRVALRRLRAALQLMHTIGAWSRLESLRSDARWLAQSLSAARDWDVFQTETLPVVAKACPSLGGFAALGEIAERHRTTAYRRIRAALSDRRATSFLLGLGEWIETRGWRSDISPETLGQLAQPAIDFAATVLQARHAKVQKRGRHFKSLTPEQRHKLRLALKKLRYSVDFLLPLYSDRKPARKYARRLAALQQQLGGYNDMATTTRLLAGLGADSTDGAIAAAAITGWQAHAMNGVEAALREAWRGFAHATPPWSSASEA
ncbi:CHAD domain-containing protein [Bradyrhizobium sp. STM 3557]|uniref:CYTH and CHAD domain-containing protein n=1 Tax=Bradyrhizobium sp. STM 3557 TaxID=578920 RepID=UPI003890323F